MVALTSTASANLWITIGKEVAKQLSLGVAIDQIQGVVGDYYKFLIKHAGEKTAIQKVRSEILRGIMDNGELSQKTKIQAFHYFTFNCRGTLENPIGCDEPMD